MKILIINCGSTSLKFQLVETGKNFKVIAKGLFDMLGSDHCKFTFTSKDKNIGLFTKIHSHKEAVTLALNTLLKTRTIRKFSDIQAVGHRVVHDGGLYKKPVKIDAKVIKNIQSFSKLAPLHNPPNLEGILACKEILKKTAQVAVFDTNYFKTLPEKAYIYPIPYDLFTKHKIRRYGFQGTSHKYVTHEALKILNNKKAKIISCHLGSGCSLTASVGGKAIDTTMGFTPLEGIMMGTRSGSIDPAIIFYLEKELKMTPAKISDFLHLKSGLKGLTGTNDLREVYKKSLKKDKLALLTIEIFCYQIAKQLGAYITALQGVDAFVFTAAIGENAFYIREKVCNYFDYLGLKLDKSKNKKNETVISDKKSKIKVLVIKTDEEKQIALETEKTLKK